ncbi:MAG: ImmA/IrrE family metallo-endopeptidase [Candidatus Roizmanbacteria bacterium]|nr:ImmA/IrrE family metallo-endopeptidase [Candidatus Roizmanbacteria bacterium]
MSADYKKAQQKAEELLNKYELSEPPIRIEDIIKGEGLSVFEVDFKSNNDLVSGFIDHDESTIYVNKYEKDDRQAFTLAHELGHWLLHKDDLKGDSDIAIMYRKTDITRNKDPREKEANCFAANLLVPKKMLDKYVHKYSLPQLAQIFGVSEQVITYRLQFEYGQSNF